MINRLADRIEEALRRDAAGRLPALPLPLPVALTPLRLPSLEPVDLDPPVGANPRVAVVTALLVPPLALGSCSPTGGGESVDPHPFDCQVLLIRRAERGRHGGQIALPGGELEGSETPHETAIRELHEELGFHAADPEHDIRFVGSLDPAYVPASNFLVQVLVAVAPQTPQITPDPREVAETLGAELGLFDPRHDMRVIEAEEQGQLLRYGVVPVPGERRVWGLTARLLCELASRLAQA
ncbi:MAG: CoA pyrophosphatase [Chloroflexi bacterium]|nr:CoA pyrophosphatase [Chloroflexota bacterium]